MKNKLTYLLLLIVITSSSFIVIQDRRSNGTMTLLTTKTVFVAGENVELQFSTNSKAMPVLYYSNSYGETLINAKLKNNILYYKIPSTISHKKGIASWKLLSKNKILSGQLKIIAQEQVSEMETYLGPPSIEAGGTDFTMLVVIPTDAFDNPAKDSTLVNVKHQFLTSEVSEEVYTKNLIAYKTIFSPLQSGKIIIGSESFGASSKEFDIKVLPAIPTNFYISAKRIHDYADGNQITTFTTSQIKDRYNNTVADGTYVEFFISTSKGAILKTSGTTVDGVATAKMIHPDRENDWIVKAIIEGMAESNTINLFYKGVINEFETSFTENNRQLTVGPLRSYMNQLIPDGLKVTLHIYSDGVLLDSVVKYSNYGKVVFLLHDDIYKSGDYTFKIETAGIENVYENKILQ